jgi:UDP-perosamine 4-acetyltransferase
MIVIAGVSEITTDFYETAIVLGYDVLILDVLGNARLEDLKSITLKEVTGEILSLPMIVSTADYPEFYNLPTDRKWIHNRMHLFSQMTSIGFKNWVSLVHPSAVVSPSAIIGSNVFVSANTTIASNSVVSDNTQINRNVSVGHNVTIGSHSEIAPGVTIAGGTTIKDEVFIGAGATVINEVFVGIGATVAAGSLVTRNVKDATLVMGSPARIRN